MGRLLLLLLISLTITTARGGRGGRSVGGQALLDRRRQGPHVAVAPGACGLVGADVEDEHCLFICVCM